MTELAKSGMCVRCGNALHEGDDAEGTCPRCMIQWAFAADPGETRTADAAPRSASPLPEGELTGRFGPYVIEGLLGQGGMGMVYRARHESLGRTVAIKVLPEALARDSQFTDRFQREARAMAALSHPRVVGVHDFGCLDGRYYFAMEHVDGGSLRDFLRRGRPGPELAFALVPDLCEALQYAHDRGVIHRDIKPENILLERSGRAKVADFGLAKIVGGSDVEVRQLTRSDLVIGTLNYMAPEQIERPRQVDHRADLYALGVVCYEMLTGELPIGRFDPPSRKARVSPAMDEAVLRALEKDPERRWARASDFAAAVRAAAASPIAPAEAPLVAVPRAPRRSSLKVVAAIAAVFLVGCLGMSGAAGYWMLARRAAMQRAQQNAIIAQQERDNAEKLEQLRRAEAEADARAVAEADAVRREAELLAERERLRQTRDEARERLRKNAEDLRRFGLGPILYDETVRRHDEAERRLAELERRDAALWKDPAAGMTPAQAARDGEIADLVERLSARHSAEEQRTAARALLAYWPDARKRVEAAALARGEEGSRAAAVLAEFDRIARLRSEGPESAVYWRAAWALLHDDPARFQAVFAAVHDADPAPAKRAQDRVERAQRTLARLMNEFSEMTSNDMERELMAGIEAEVKEAGLPILPGLLAVLEEDATSAFSRVTDQPFESVYSRRITARDQVKAIFGLAWLGRKEAVPALARNLDHPSLTAASNAAGAIERITGVKFAAEGEVVLLSNESLQRARDWWRAHAAEYLPAEQGK